MKINSIKYFTNNTVPSFKRTAVPYPEYQRQAQALSFKHTAVPYPEYESLRKEEKNKGIIEELAGRISNLFHPEVQKTAADIKANIDNIYDKKENNKGTDLASQSLLSVLA